MEHTGATLYNDTQMFLGKHPTPDEELRRVQLIAHETAHMWFGDYVTMKWFDDVWTKEVFANYFAARITEPMFPGINHRLNWLKSITSAALGEDRTAGGTAIRQPLDNMRHAGLIYNNIVYNKAPVMLEKLIELMGEEAFREGIHDYLVKYAYSNASWDDLIAILDSKSSEDLATFSDVWVNSNGMPHIELVKEKERITARQGDPRDRAMLWPQSFGVTLVGDTMREIEVIMHGKESSVNAAGAGEATILLPNSDGRGYGYFRYDSTSLAWALGNWHGISDETCRQAQLMNLHEAYQHGDIDAGSWLQSLITGLKNEENALIASTACSYIGRPLTEAKDAAKERELLGMAESHSLTSCRLQLLRTLISTATDSTVCTALYTMWQEATHPLLNENDYMNMAYELALRYPQMHKEITATQRARIKNPDRQRQFDFVSRAVTPDTAAQEALFRSLLIAENRRIEPWALKTMGYLCHTLREEQATRYIRPALDALQEIQRTSDIFFPQNWTRTLLRERHSSEALNEVERFLNDNPGYPALLRSKIMQAAWTLQRVNKNQ
jgi:aminopeptidase N